MNHFLPLDNILTLFIHLIMHKTDSKTIGIQFWKIFYNALPTTVRWYEVFKNVSKMTMDVKCDQNVYGNSNSQVMPLWSDQIMKMCFQTYIFGREGYRNQSLSKSRDSCLYFKSSLLQNIFVVNEVFMTSFISTC